MYAAARDYLHVITSWPGNKEAYLGLVQCLIALKWNKVANDWLVYFRQRFGEFANSAQVSNTFVLENHPYLFLYKILCWGVLISVR